MERGIQEAKTTTSKSCSISSSSSLHATTSKSSSTSSKSHLTTNNTISLSKNNSSHGTIYIDVYKRIKASLSKSISLLRAKCFCFDKNSLQVKENIPKPKISNTTTSPTFQIQTLSQNQITRNSFCNKTTPKDNLKIDDHENQQEPASDSSMHVFQLTSPHKSRAMDEDVVSDASSDLFEIEGFCFSTQATTTSTNVLCDT
ncbi:actin-binding protein F [Trifolium repens]|nr:actin-binding protein F [Trifolium repens]